MPDPWQIGDLARQDLYPDERYMQPPPAIPAATGEGYAGLGGDPSHLASTIKNWWTNQPSWLEKAKAENLKTSEAFQRGGMGEIAKQLATDTTEAQDLVSAFGVGNIKGVKSPLAPGALAATDVYHPPFYSAVERAVQGAKQNAAPGQQWAGFLRNQPGVKPEEVEALKLGKLFEQPGSVPKEAVLGEIAANRVNVGEVIKGTPHNYPHRTADEWEAAIARAEARGDWDEGARLTQAQEGVNPATGSTAGSTKFSQYTLPGGENYREMLLTLPEKPISRVATSADEGLGGYLDRTFEKSAQENPVFKSPHYDEPNILAHVRYNDRVIDGKKTLFVEEVQSDWHQKGKREGYREKEHATRDEIWRQYNEYVARGQQNTPEAQEVLAQYHVFKNLAGGVPDAPFKTTWPELAMKRIIREAAEKGYDKVAWTPGSVQADRYDLSKQISKVSYVNNYLNAWDHSGNKVMSRADIKPNDLPDYIGKEAAQKLLDQTPKDYSRMSYVRRGDLSVTQSEHQYHVKNPDGREVAIGKGTVGSEGEALDYAERYLNKSADEINQKRQLAHDNLGPTRELSGLDLKVGGEGMKGFYDEILPATVNRLVKKHGGRVTQADMTAASAASPERVHTLDITPSLRAAAMKGFPLFTAGGVAATGIMGEMARQDEYR